MRPSLGLRRVLSVIVGLSLVVVIAAPVAADNNCNGGELCLWGTAGFGGDFWDPSTSDPDWPFFGIENDDDAVQNNETTRNLVYNNSNYGSFLYCVAPGELEDDIADARDNQGDSNFLSSLTSCGTLARP
jgi:hypothetical protein